ncbi:MAG: hypothetical protein P0116_15760, partial [Candidatus Nitrosocosmicus sp.]|nr:hypothetical protein [Candidatus Nitrosocosmicus sp.]
VVIFRSIINSDCYNSNLTYKCMYESSFPKILQNNNTKLAMLSAVFVGIMVFLVPELVEDAQARIEATASTTAGPFSNVAGQLIDGDWRTQPRLVGPIIFWETTGSGIFGGSERGIVTANVGLFGQVTFVFSNPSRGANTCETVVNSGPFQGSCTITQGNSAQAVFHVYPQAQQSESSYCGILNKFGSEHTEVIRDKLNC